MSDRPEIKLEEWISVGSIPAVVSRVKKSSDLFGYDEVVFNPSKPTNHDVEWTGESWQFVKSTGDYGGYADKYSRLRRYVEILKRGRR